MQLVYVFCTADRGDLIVWENSKVSAQKEQLPLGEAIRHFMSDHVNDILDLTSNKVHN